MEKYVAFLRGINVGGKNKISMPLLKTAFEDACFLSVRTYINSGNVIFECNNKNTYDIKLQCENIIKKNFGLDISVVVVSHNDLNDMLLHAPEWWDADSECNHNAIFIIPPTTADDILLKIESMKHELEKIYSYKNLIFWTAPKNTINKTVWIKIANTTAYAQITIRNANTAKKLLTLSKV